MAKMSQPVIANFGKSDEGLTVSERKISNATIRSTSGYKNGEYFYKEEVVDAQPKGSVGCEDLAGARAALPK